MKELMRIISELSQNCLELTDDDLLQSLFGILQQVFPALRTMQIESDISPPDLQALLEANFGLMAGSLEYLGKTGEGFTFKGEEIAYDALWKFDLLPFPKLNLLDRVSQIIEHIPSRFNFRDTFRGEFLILQEIATEILQQEQEKKHVSVASRKHGRKLVA